MRRSTAVAKLQKFLEKQGITDDSSAASIILKKIEKMGMLPPEANFPRTPGAGCYCTVSNCTFCGGYVNEWEPE